MKEGTEAGYQIATEESAVCGGSPELFRLSATGGGRIIYAFTRFKAASTLNTSGFKLISPPWLLTQ
jgi:hypothetical protein